MHFSLQTSTSRLPFLVYGARVSEPLERKSIPYPPYVLRTFSLHSDPSQYTLLLLVVTTHIVISSYCTHFRFDFYYLLIFSSQRTVYQLNISSCTTGLTVTYSHGSILQQGTLAFQSPKILNYSRSASESNYRVLLFDDCLSSDRQKCRSSICNIFIFTGTKKNLLALGSLRGSHGLRTPHQYCPPSIMQSI